MECENKFCVRYLEKFDNNCCILSHVKGCSIRVKNIKREQYITDLENKIVILKAKLEVL